MQPKYHILNCTFLLLFLFCFPIKNILAQDKPNILVVIADDLGVDVSNGYHQGGLMPTTPTLDSLRSTGITFENVFSAPKCTPSRASIISGKFGVKTGVQSTPGNLTLDHTSIFKELENQTNNQYTDAVIGKWHLSGSNNTTHPLGHSVDHFMGVLSSGVSDYYAWEKTENGTTTIDSNYVTEVFTDAAIDWIDDQPQNQPWFLWLAHVAPHAPIHLPPSHMYSISGTGTNFRKYIAMIESVDFSLNRLLSSMPDDVRENTIIIYLGDNGTPNNFLQDYPSGHGKSSVYQGGVRVPMIISGAGVDRFGERESALVHINDIYATVLEIAGAELEGGLFNSLSFDHLLKNEQGATRDYNYTDLIDGGDESFTIRNEQYKLIEFVGSSQEFYDLLADSLETNNLLLGTLTSDQQMIKADLEAEALVIRTAWSCRDHIRNGDETGIDCGGSLCADCTVSIDENVNYTIRIFPNPISNQLIVESENEEIQEINIYDGIGRLVFSKKEINSLNEIIEVNHFNNGIYFVEVKNENQIFVEKIIKE